MGQPQGVKRTLFTLRWGPTPSRLCLRGLRRSALPCTTVRSVRGSAQRKSKKIITVQHALCRGPRVTVRSRRSRRSEEHTSELQSRPHLVCRLLLEKKKKTKK